MQRSLHHSPTVGGIVPARRTQARGQARTRAFAGALCALVLALAGCTDRGTDLVGPGQTVARTVFGEQSATLAWQQTARDLVLKYRNDPLAATRIYALVSVARYAALMDASEGGGRRELEAERGAIAAASASTLAYLFPSEMSFLEGLVDAERERPGQSHPHFLRGELHGRAAAARVIERARTDGFGAPWSGQVPVGAGLWLSSGPPPVQPLLGSMLPFSLSSGDQFRPGPPPAFGSAEFLTALAEVAQISSTRSAGQLAIAQFWAMRAGTVTSQGYWDEEAAKLIVAAGLDDMQAAHVLALLDAAAVDAMIACWDAKYTYWTIRPSQVEPAITLPIGLPGHPSYPSGHSCVSGSSSEILGQLFPLHADRLAAAAIEAGRSRVYAGIHYQFDADAGLALGQVVGRNGLAVDRSRGVLSALD